MGLFYFCLSVCLILWKIGLNLRSRQVGKDPAVEVGDSDDQEETEDTGAAVDEAASAEELEAEPVSQLKVVKKTIRRTRVAKRTLSCITAPIDAFQIPGYAFMPSNTELIELLYALYDAQTHLIASYDDLPGMLELLPNLVCSLLIVTVDQPQLIDFKQFVPHIYSNHLGAVRSPPLLEGRDDILKSLNGVYAISFLLKSFCVVLLLTISCALFLQVFRIVPYPWYFSTDTITKDMITNTSVPLNCITEFILFYPLGSRKSNPFPFRPKEMFEEGYPKRLFCNSILVPGLPVKQRLRALENAQNPKQVLDVNEQQAMTWFQMFSLFSEPTNFPVVLNIGSGVGVCTFFFLLYALFACVFHLLQCSHCFKLQRRNTLQHFLGSNFFLV